MGQMQEAKLIEKKPRPLVRIALLLMSHRVLVSFLCCIAGVIALLVLPILAKNTYISENALMPGSANPMLSSQDVSDGNNLVADIMGLNLELNTAGIEIPRILAKRIANLGAEASQFQFHPRANKFHPLHFFSSQGHDIMQVNCSWPAVSTVGIIRAPRGDGKEAIVLVTPYHAVKPDIGEALSLGVAYSVFSLLTQVTWLAKDIIWLAADSRYGEYESVAAWLREYYAPAFDSLKNSCVNLCYATNHRDEKLKEHPFIGAQHIESFRRAGTMAGALVIKVANGSKEFKDALGIYAEASNGQMPNLDLINVVNYLAVHRQGLHVKVDKLWSLLDSKCLMMVGKVIEFLGNLARSVNPQWGFEIPVGEYVEGTATLASSLYAQALGVPTGPHGAFRDYQIDAITMVLSPRSFPHNNVKRSEFLMRSGRLVEGVIRSVNNLLEKFHQSFFLYLLIGPSKFVSVGVYMIAFALLIAPLPIVAASLYSDAIKFDPKPDKEKASPHSSASVELVISRSSCRWLHAAKTLFLIHAWAVIVALLPYFICQIPNRTPTTSILSWVMLSVFSLHILYMVLGSPFPNSGASPLQNQEWAMLKSVMIAAVSIGLSLMSIMNFATAEIGALLLVPLCLMAHPLKLDLQARSAKAIARTASNLVLGLLVFPPISFFFIKGLVEGFSGIDIGGFWNWVESLWLWNSASYLYIVLVHLPCWVLCIHILLHPC